MLLFHFFKPQLGTDAASVTAEMVKCNQSVVEWSLGVVGDQNKSRL